MKAASILKEVCRMVDTLLLDQEVIYDSRNSNDRLLLGLKGSLNEYELDLLRQRSQEARRQKAARGELLIAAPVGYIKTADQRLEKDPDGRVQEAIHLIYKKFFELGTVRQTLLWFVDQGLDLPVAQHSASGSRTLWKRPCYGGVLNILRDPIYAGAYRYGRTVVTTVAREGRLRKRTVRKPLPKWSVLIPNHHEGYITWDQFQQVQQMITNNSQTCFRSGPGAAKKGRALLAGLLRCRKCGRKLMVSYTGQQHDKVRYLCRRGALDQGEPKCISFGGSAVDEAIAREVLRVVEPAAMEAAAQAAQQQTSKDEEVLRVLNLELEAARYEAERARRQYDLADPENRLVTGELERRWDIALGRVREMENRVAQAQSRRKPMVHSPQQLLGDLKEDLEAVWEDSQTDVRVKKRIVRTLIEEVIADVDSGAGEVILVVHWKGDTHTEVRLRRRRRGQSSGDTPVETIQVVRTLALICNDNRIAGFLNRNGLRTGPGNRWTRERVVSLRNYHGIPVYSEEKRKSEGWMNLGEAAAYLQVASKTLRRAAERGEVPALHPLDDAPWLFKRADLDLLTAWKDMAATKQDPVTLAGQDRSQLHLELSRT